MTTTFYRNLYTLTYYYLITRYKLFFTKNYAKLCNKMNIAYYTIILTIIYSTYLTL